MKLRQGKAVLFVNGDLPNPAYIRNQISGEDFLIAVDGGLRHIIRLDLVPDLIIGDLDSARADDITHFHRLGVEVRQYPEVKDETDLEIALKATLSMQPRTIWVVAALGNRIDQTLGNIFLLTHPDFADSDIRLIDGHEEVFIIRHTAKISGHVGDQVSLLPLHGSVVGIDTQGLQYPLTGDTLFADHTRGISNRMTKSTAVISVQTGLLLCVHTLNEAG